MTGNWTPPGYHQMEFDDIQRVQSAFDFNPFHTDSIPIENTGIEFNRLSDSERNKVIESLKERRDNASIEKFGRLIARWKRNIAKNQASSKTLEKLTKTSLGIDAELRFSDAIPQDLTKEDKKTHQDVYRLSQAFLNENVGSELSVYRGIRAKSVADLVSQVIDDPDADEYFIKTSVISNHTLVQEIAFLYSNGIVLDWSIPRDRVTMAIDQIFKTPDPEAEVHVAGGTIELSPYQILHEGKYTRDIRRIQTTVNRVNNPQKMSDLEHKDFSHLLFITAKHLMGVRTEDGSARLNDWYTYVLENLDFPKAHMELLKFCIDILTDKNNNPEIDLTQ